MDNQQEYHDPAPEYVGSREVCPLLMIPSQTRRRKGESRFRHIEHSTSSAQLEPQMATLGRDSFAVKDIIGANFVTPGMLERSKEYEYTVRINTGNIRGSQTCKGRIIAFSISAFVASWRGSSYRSPRN